MGLNEWLIVLVLLIIDFVGSWVYYGYIKPKKDNKFYKDQIKLEDGYVVLKSGTGELKFNHSTGKPVGGRGYNPEDWVDRPEFVRKTEEQLVEIVNRSDVKDFDQIVQKVSYCEKISENLMDELTKLNVDTIDEKLAAAFGEAFFVRSIIAPYSDENITNICFDASHLFDEIADAIENKTFEALKFDFKQKIDTIKLELESYNLSMSPEEHKKVFNEMLIELLK